MPQKIQFKKVATRSKVISVVRTPLGFLALLALIVDTILGVAAMRTTGFQLTLIVSGMLSLLLVLVVTVVYMAVKHFPSLTGSHVMAQREESRRGVHLDAPAVSKDLGLSCLYYGGSDNRARNESKQKAVKESRGDVVLLAHSGHAYLAGCHKSSIKAFLEDKNKTGKFIVILLNPFSLAAIGMYLNWLRSFEADGLDMSDIHAIDHLLPKKVKFLDSLLSYRSLRNNYDSRLELRFTSFDIGCTVLWTDNAYFIEPYFRFNPAERAERKLTTYEMELDSESPMADQVQYGYERPTTHLNFYYRYSVLFEDWCKTQKAQIASGIDTLNFMADSGEISWKEANCLTSYLPHFIEVCKYDSSG